VIRGVKGAPDILPEESGKWQALEAVARDVLDRYGYGEIRTPAFEHTELFVRGIGEGTDIVEKEMYTFEDRGGESLTLRPEATASLMRAYMEHNLGAKNSLVKFYLIGPMFRHERPQSGRFRQFHQIDAEAVGRCGVSEECLRPIHAFFTTCEHIRFAPSAGEGDMQGTLSLAQEIVRQLERRRRLSRGSLDHESLSRRESSPAPLPPGEAR
jgi:histidyl-tRNA synthetase